MRGGRLSAARHSLPQKSHAEAGTAEADICDLPTGPEVPLTGAQLVGRRIGVLWPEHYSYFLGRVTCFSPEACSCYTPEASSQPWLCWSQAGQSSALASRFWCMSGSWLLKGKLPWILQWLHRRLFSHDLGWF